MARLSILDMRADVFGNSSQTQVDGMQEQRNRNQKFPGKKMLLAFQLSFLALLATAGQASATTFYVSRGATGPVYDGKSWSTAWKDFSIGYLPGQKIDWSVIKPGDRIEIGSGTYESPIIVEKSGVAITVDRSVFYGGLVNITGGTTPTATNSYQFKTSGNVVMISSSQIDPKFVSDVSTLPNYTSFLYLCGVDFSLRPDSPCTGIYSYPKSAEWFMNNVPPQ